RRPGETGPRHGRRRQGVRARDSRMHPRPLEHLVHRVPRAVHREADQVQVGGADGADRRAVGLVVAGGEQVAGEDGPGQGAGEDAGVGGAQRLLRALEDQHRLAEHRQVADPVRVLVGLPDHLGVLAAQAADQERGDVEALPGLQVVAQQDGDLRVEAWGRHAVETADRGAPASCTLFAWPQRAPWGRPGRPSPPGGPGYRGSSRCSTRVSRSTRIRCTCTTPGRCYSRTPVPSGTTWTVTSTAPRTTPCPCCRRTSPTTAPPPPRTDSASGCSTSTARTSGTTSSGPPSTAPT